MEEDVDVQPTGKRVEQTLDVVGHVLTDKKWFEDVCKANNWDNNRSAEEIAILFLASRYQWTVSLLAKQNSDLLNKVVELENRLENLEDTHRRSLT